MEDSSTKPASWANLATILPRTRTLCLKKELAGLVYRRVKHSCSIFEMIPLEKEIKSEEKGRVWNGANGIEMKSNEEHMGGAPNSH